METDARRPWWLPALLLSLSTILSLLLVEAAAQVYAAKIAGKAKLFQADPNLGWSMLPNLDVVRRDPIGGTWTIRTGGKGWRGPDGFVAGKRKILVAGDSFVMGENVEQEQRFDHVLAGSPFDASVVNVGVMGFGTDQQLLAAAPYLSELGAGDLFVLVTYSNDFYDLCLQRHSGRAKPYYALTGDGQLRLHPPVITAVEWLRDKSFLFAVVARVFEPHHDAADARALTTCARIYERLVLQTSDALAARGAKTLVVRHGLDMVNVAEHRAIAQASLDNVCAAPSVRCLDLDPSLTKTATQALYFDHDIHWNQAGHEKVAGLLAAAAAEALGLRR